ncbi:hypothetical protein HAQ01_16830 [Acidithiobacillus thiooxidans]|uniref:hypothetical protein n=1 Tax=Acidithiobacillus thiooxidans TaxID=930 RepID=UPI000262513D|nr:hypothetical protein [Acidithiobacillus thiooxidans]MBU2795013.1 hypothetical protein [Acidithiobacillus thiooxidans]
MDWASIAEVISAIATVALAGATFWMGSQSKKSIGQTKEMYEKDNTPMLVFDFDFDKNALIAMPPNPENDDDGRFWTVLSGTLSNVSNTPAVECVFAVFRTDNGIHFEEPINLVNALPPKESLRLDQKLIQHDQMKNAGNDMRKVNSYGEYLECQVPTGSPCPFVVIFSCKNRFGNQFYTAYQIIHKNGLYKAKSIFLGSEPSAYNLGVSCDMAKEIERTITKYAANKTADKIEAEKTAAHQERTTFIKNIFKIISQFVIIEAVFALPIILLYLFGKGSSFWTVTIGIIMLLEAILFFALTIDMIHACSHKIQRSSVGFVMIQLFLLGANISGVFIVFYALIYDVKCGDNASNLIFYNSAQYFFNTGDTPKWFAGKFPWWQISESVIGYGFYPAYLGAIFYAFTKKHEALERKNNARKKFYQKFMDWMVTC